jgi:hypothetical protein
MKTLVINKLAPAYKDYFLSREPNTLTMATNTDRAIWKKNKPARYKMPKFNIWP